MLNDLWRSALYIAALLVTAGIMILLGGGDDQ